MPTESARQALSILRDPSQFQWYVVPLLVTAVYVYAVEIERRRWDVVLAGLAFWGMDWFNEIWNGLLFHFTHFAPAWSAPADTAYLILIGLNIEISFMFAMLGLIFAKTLPPDRETKIFGLPNRLFIAIAGSLFCVCVELLLNGAGALTWDWWWWNAKAPWLIFLLGYLTFFLVGAWVYDMPGNRARRRTVGAIYTFDAICLLVFGTVLGWI